MKLPVGTKLIRIAPPSVRLVDDIRRANVKLHIANWCLSLYPAIIVPNIAEELTNYLFALPDIMRITMLNDLPFADILQRGIDSGKVIEPGLQQLRMQAQKFSVGS
ncbi:MAG: hypothetical protein ABW007_18930 [Chitinophagaceae bacterium]